MATGRWDIRFSLASCSSPRIGDARRERRLPNLEPVEREVRAVVRVGEQLFSPATAHQVVVDSPLLCSLAEVVPADRRRLLVVELGGRRPDDPPAGLAKA